MKALITVLFFTLACCDGKPPEFTEKKIDKSNPVKKDAQQEENSLLNKQWAIDAFWESGNEEIATYFIRRKIGEQTIKFEETRITRKEVFSRQAYSLTTDSTRSDLISVISQHVNGIRVDTTSELATYASSVAVLQRDPIITAKFISNWSDQNGTSTKSFQRLVGRTMLYTHSWAVDTEGKGDNNIDLGKNDFLLDQLPLSLRALNFQTGKEFYWMTLTELLLPNQKKPIALDMNYQIQSVDTLTLGFKKYPCWRIAVQANQESSMYWFETKFPHVLVKIESESTQLDLKSVHYQKRKASILRKAIL